MKQKHRQPLFSYNTPCDPSLHESPILTMEKGILSIQYPTMKCRKINRYQSEITIHRKGLNETLSMRISIQTLIEVKN